MFDLTHPHYRDLMTTGKRQDDGCMECGGPGVVTDAPEDTFYILPDGDVFCSIDCIERWHGIEIEGV